MKMVGIAKNTAFNQKWLDTCDVVTLYERVGDYLHFKFDPEMEVYGPIPHGIWFDPDTEVTR